MPVLEPRNKRASCIGSLERTHAISHVFSPVGTALSIFLSFRF